MFYKAFELYYIKTNCKSMVLMGTIPVHRKEGEIVIYSVGGMPVEDVAWGTVVYRNALEKGIGTKLKLWDHPELA